MEKLAAKFRNHQVADGFICPRSLFADLQRPLWKLLLNMKLHETVFLSFAESTIARKFEESEPHQNLGTVYNLVCLLQSVTFTFSDLAWFSPDLVHVHGIVQLQLTTILWESHTCPDDLILQLAESLEICPIHCLNTYIAFQIVHSQFLFY